MSTNCLATNRPKRPAAVEANDKLTGLNKSKRLRLVEKKTIRPKCSNSNASTSKSVRVSAINVTLVSTNNQASQDSLTDGEETGLEESFPGIVG